MQSNENFTQSVEALVNSGGFTCANCGKPATIKDSLICCEGSCGYGASIDLNISIECEDALESALKRMGQRLARSRQQVALEAMAYMRELT